MRALQGRRRTNMNPELLLKRFKAHRAIAVCALVLVSIPAAQATVLDNAGASVSLAGTAKNGSFLDVYFFSLSQTLGLSESLSYNNRVGVGMINNFNASLFTAIGLTPLLSGTDGVPGTNLTNNQFYAPSLAAGAYRLEISGIGSGFLGGGYTGTLTAVPAFAPLLAVPEPESWAMMFAGLALMLIRVRQVAAKTAADAISLREGPHHAERSGS